MPRLLALAIEKGYYDSPIAGVRTRIAPKWLSALPIPPKIQPSPEPNPLIPITSIEVIEFFLVEEIFLFMGP